MNPKLKEKILESLSAVLPITGIVLLLSIFLVPLETGAIVMFFVGALLLIIGMGMFQLGAEMAMSPLGEGIGVQISKLKHLFFIALISLLMGVLITMAEPDLQVLSDQVPAVPNSTLIFTVALGVGLFLALAVLRILLKINLAYLLTGLYLILILLSFFVPKDFLAVAFDSGGVTTGPITVPFIMAMGVGLSSVRADKDAANDSFGLVALSSVGPILSVLLLGYFFNPQDAAYSKTIVPDVTTMQDVMIVFAKQFPRYIREVLISIIPLAAMFLVFQLISRRYQHRQRLRIAVGFGYTYAGLVLFLCGVNVGFAPVGSLIGHDLAGTNQKWLLVPIGMLIGYYIVKAEPAVYVLMKQVEELTDGAISGSALQLSLSVGVAVSIGLAMTRVLTGMSVMCYLIPGYGVAIVLSFFVPKIFTAIAFDSGGVASGPMTATFLLPFALGACQAVGGNLVRDAFGVVAMVAMTPLITIQTLGLASELRKHARSRYLKYQFEQI